jgi:lipopolysaccharide transport system ATP-binding protein
MSVVIDVHNLGKLYRLGQVGTGTLSHDLKRWYARAMGKDDPFTKIGSINDRTQHATAKEYVWALKDMSLRVEEGDIVGVIGRNGAGKSTLLKMLSRITAPTTGSIKIKGRIGSLLEVGTGFHPEMTGRENVYMNGTVLGMRRAEIDRKFEEIVEFSGVSKYIDTPVKRYSSGMLVRLGFAVAAFLEPEILIVDEVLAVGDAEFQKKALGRMQDVSKYGGRTVLFVSHNMAAIQNLCTKGLYLEQGKLCGVGNVKEQIDKYLQGFKLVYQQLLKEREDRSGSREILFTNVTLKTFENEIVNSFITGQNVKILLSFEKKEIKKLNNFIIALGINDGYGNRIANLNNEVTQEIFTEVSEEVTSVEVAIKHLPLMPGKYDLTIYSSINGIVADWLQNAFSFSVESGDFFGTGKLIPNGQGNFLINHSFKLSK